MHNTFQHASYLFAVVVICNFWIELCCPQLVVAHELFLWSFIYLSVVYRRVIRGDSMSSKPFSSFSETQLIACRINSTCLLFELLFKDRWRLIYNKVHAYNLNFQDFLYLGFRSWIAQRVNKNPNIVPNRNAKEIVRIPYLSIKKNTRCISNCKKIDSLSRLLFSYILWEKCAS